MRRSCDDTLAKWLLRTLQMFGGTYTRDQLVSNYMWEFQWFIPSNTKPSTVARQMRLAFNELERDGYPVISDGHGFRLATTPEERTKAAKKLEKMGLSLLKRASIIRGLTLDGEMKQLSLEGL